MRLLKFGRPELPLVILATFLSSISAFLHMSQNVFVGMVEAPLLIRSWLARLTRSEMFVVMVAGLATISGNTLVVYATLLAPVVPDAAGQLLAASLIAFAVVLTLLLMGV